VHSTISTRIFEEILLWTSSDPTAFRVQFGSVHHFDRIGTGGRVWGTNAFGDQSDSI
jgi:hypothetical protein